MIPYQLYAAVKAGIGEEIAATKDKLARGHWQSEAAGKRLCGEIDGLERALVVLQQQYDRQEKLEGEDTDDD